MQINLNPTSERGASRDAVNRPRETLGDSHLISSDPRSRFGLVCDLLCCRGNIYHAINRGNNRADVLGPEGERDMFLGDLARTKARYPFALFGYCLMSNHFHLLLKPAPGQSISRILQSLTVAHTWRHHRRQGTSGHVWQGRFRSPVIQDGDHLLVVLKYIEPNPVRAAMVADPCEYTWSSHRCHGAGHADPILDSFPEWEQFSCTEPERRARWQRKVRGEQPAKELDGVRSSVRSGRPYGAED